MKDHINHDIKKREWYRPFAPAVLFEKQSEIFDLDVYSPHMLVTSNVLPEWKSKIPSVTHVDGSARYQSVTEESNFRFYSIIKSFYDLTGVPVLLNTSFNGPREPIVETPSEAIGALFSYRKLSHFKKILNKNDYPHRINKCIFQEIVDDILGL